jgi:hypothetical protein
MPISRGSSTQLKYFLAAGNYGLDGQYYKGDFYIERNAC